MRNRLIITLSLVLLLVIGFIIYFNKSSNSLEPEEGLLDASVDELADMILNENLSTLEGKESKLKDMIRAQDDYLLVDVWATWCPPCVAALTDYQKNFKYFQDKKIRIVAVASGEDAKTVRGFIDKHALSLDVLLDSKQVSLSSWGVKGIPTIYLISKKGELLVTKVGYLNFSNFQTELEEALEK